MRQPERIVRSVARRLRITFGALACVLSLPAALAQTESAAWEKLREACRAPADKTNPAAELIAALDGQIPEALVLAAFISDPATNPSCQAMLVKYISANRARYARTADGALLARAFLSLADSDSRPADVRSALERGAVSLDDADELMRRMLDRCRSGDPDRIEEGVALLGASCDERAPDSLLAFLRSLAGTGAHPSALAKAMFTAGRSLGGRAFDLLSEVYRLTPDPSLRQAALIGLAYTGDLRFIPLLLSAYDKDNATVANSTGREFWYLARLSEEAIIQSLDSGDSTAEQAFELADRATRLGPPADADRLCAALRVWSVRSSDSAARAGAIIARLNSHAAAAK